MYSAQIVKTANLSNQRSVYYYCDYVSNFNVYNVKINVEIRKKDAITRCKNKLFEIRNLYKQFNNQTTALNHVNLDIYPWYYNDYRSIWKW